MSEYDIYLNFQIKEIELTFIFVFLHHWLPDALTNVHEPVCDLFAIKTRLLHQLELALLVEVRMINMGNEPLFQYVLLPILKDAFLTCSRFVGCILLFDLKGSSCLIWM